jgi:hypothetical protein
MAFTSGTESSTILLKQSEINFDLFDLWDQRDRFIAQRAVPSEASPRRDGWCSISRRFSNRPISADAAPPQRAS